MIYNFNCLADAYVSDIKGNICVNIDGTAYIETDDRSIDEITSEKWRQIEAVREAKYSNGVNVNGYWFQTSAWSKINYMGAAMLGDAFTGTNWKTMSGELVWLTGQLAGQIMAAIAGQTDAIFKAAQSHKESMMASEDPSVYDFSEGWPETFGEYQET